MGSRAYLDTTGEWGRKAERERKAKPHYVYFIECQSVEPPRIGPIKIGLAADPKQRIESMTGHNPYPLRILSVIECEDFAAAAKEEKDWHVRFGECRVHREWFNPTHALLTAIEVNAVPWAPPEPPRFEIPRTREELMDFFGLREDD